VTARSSSSRVAQDLGALCAILLLAALIRLPGLPERATWDSDQGNHMLVLLDLVRHGTVPLLGPSTFAGVFHHGALYYWLLAPAALLTDADPIAVTLEIALLGIATVGVVAALGRELGGRWAGHIAALLAAVSPAFIAGSTFIWNPNPVPLGSAIAFLGVVRSWRRRDLRWWLLAAFGAMLAMQLHVSGAMLLLPLGAVYAIDLRRSRAVAARTRFAITIGCAAIIAAGYLPLLAHEIGHGFSETRGLLGYLGGGAGAGTDAVTRSLIVFLRSVAWPFVGVVTEAPMAAAIATVAVVLLWIIAARFGRRSGRTPSLILAGVVAWSIPALALTAPSLSVSIAGLPNDHYHTYLDPIMVVVAACGIVAIARRLRLAEPRRAPAWIVSGGLAVALVALAVVRWPPAVALDGGWPIADAAAARVLTVTRATPILLDGIPPFKSADALRFPLERRGGSVLADGAAEPAPGAAAVVLVCDPLFDEVVGAACGGAAEDLWMAAEPGRSGWALVERFDSGSRRVISIYALGTVPDATP